MTARDLKGNDHALTLDGLEVPERFGKALRAVEALAAQDRYLAALVFGSVAAGSASEASDLDVRVVVGEDNPCKNINHPRIGGVKLDITFQSLRQLERQTEEQIGEGRRRRMATRINLRRRCDRPACIYPA